MQVRNEYERRGLLDIGRIVASILEELRAAARPGVTTADLDALAGRLLGENDAYPTPMREYDFPGRLCISVNDEVVHGIPGERELREGDLVKLDLTADRRGFVADATRMAFVGEVDDLVRRISGSVENACRSAIAAARTGMELKELGRVVEDAVVRDGFTVVRILCGHGVGRRVHEEPEVPNYPDNENSGVLRQGMVITIEPIISAGSPRLRELGDGWTLVTGDGSLSAHYEDTIIIGDDGAEVVTVCS